MPEAHGQALIWLVLAIAALFFVIVGVLVLSARKKNKQESQPRVTEKAQSALDTKDPSLTPVAKDFSLTAAKKDHAPAVEAPASVQIKKEEPMQSMEQALSATKENFWGRIKNVFGSNLKVDQIIENVEEVLYTSDLGPQTVSRLLDKVQAELSSSEKADVNAVHKLLKKEMMSILTQAGSAVQIEKDVFKPFEFSKDQLTVWLIVGVNGAGKTTTIGKLASRLAEANKKVLVAAGDTFRAAAGEQLKAWTTRAQVEIFSPDKVTDPAAVAFDAVSMAKARGYDVVLIDTAGRLHTQSNLMEELKKVKRVIQKVLPEAPHETILVLDGNSGQNALIQAREFKQAIGVNSVVLTKMDGTSKGGVVLGVSAELNLPIKLIGIGEKIQDLRPFAAAEFVDSILG